MPKQKNKRLFSGLGDPLTGAALYIFILVATESKRRPQTVSRKGRRGVPCWTNRLTKPLRRRRIRERRRLNSDGALEFQMERVDPDCASIQARQCFLSTRRIHLEMRRGGSEGTVERNAAIFTTPKPPLNDARGHLQMTSDERGRNAERRPVGLAPFAQF